VKKVKPLKRDVQLRRDSDVAFESLQSCQRQRLKLLHWYKDQIRSEKITCQVHGLNLKENGKEVARFFAETEKVISET
jgi:hypothetical protein